MKNWKTKKSSKWKIKVLQYLNVTTLANHWRSSKFLFVVNLVEGTVFCANVMILHPFSHYMIIILHPKYTQQAILLTGWAALLLGSSVLYTTH
jgi:hypothetical protein